MERIQALSATRLHFFGDREVHSILQEDESFGLFHLGKQSLDELLLKKTRATCDRYKIEFAQLSTIQRKFLTHFRCSQCGLVPLYQINLLHIKRVRCRKCGQLVGFKRTGKYGKLRKEIAIELVKEVQRDV
jgi:predicted nucleic-acid-binding Zn-ribbon protein